MTGARTVAERLGGSPADADETSRRVPRGPGLYAWWAPPGLVPGVAGPAHPGIEGLELLYIGLAMDLRKRVAGNHFRGPTGSSTLRRALVALLMTAEGYTTRWATDRVVPIETDEERLSVWMREHLRVTWAEHPTPEDVEAAVITELGPPLNQRDNQSHPLYATIRSARAAYRASAGPRPRAVE